jgi:geranylgeranyl diphosphate synthase type I
MTLTSIVEDLTDRIDSELRSIVTSREMPLYRMMSYHMGWSDQLGEPEQSRAKGRTHGVLCLLACRAAGGDPETALPAAAATELVHNFCQIHDDVQGGIPQRDDRDAVWWVWGPAQAINTGDGMHALARLVVFRLQQHDVSSDTTFRAVQLLDEASLSTCEGRFLDLEAQERIDMSVDAYLRMAAAKTGALMSCAMSLGALVSSAPTAAVDAMGEAGLKLGVALQMRDDLLELWGPSETDAPPAHEVMNKKKLLPVVLALEKANLTQKRSMGEVYFKRVLEPDDVARLRGTLDDMGVREECENLVEQHLDAAVGALEVLSPDVDGKADLQAFMKSLLRE